MCVAKDLLWKKEEEKEKERGEDVEVDYYGRARLESDEKLSKGPMRFARADNRAQQQQQQRLYSHTAAHSLYLLYSKGVYNIYVVYLYKPFHTLADLPTPRS